MTEKNAVQRVHVVQDANVPQRVAGQFLRIKYDLAIAAQKLPEMTDDEVVAANAAHGGFDWLEEPAEDVY